MTHPKPLETQLRAFFGFKNLPFAKHLEPHELFRLQRLEHAQERLRYLVDRRGIGALFGAPGTGKSTLLRAFLDSLSKTAHATVYICHSSCATLDLLRQIAHGFQLAPALRKADLVRQIQERLFKLACVQKLSPVLVFDEAHLLPGAFLDELRLLTSFEADARDYLTLILAGHPQLESNLRLAVNEALAQRLILRLRLNGLAPAEVPEYVKFRLERAGRTAALFLPDALEALAKASRGVPRLIDRLAEHALLLAFQEHHKDVGVQVLNQAIEEVEP
jgi:type II secretory pathway predicted ATPase ExeA